MPEECCAFLWGELFEGSCDAVPELGDASRGGFSEEGLELGEGQFDRIEVGRIRRQVEEGRAGRFDEFADPRHLVSREVVHDDDITRGQDGDEHLVDVDEERITIHRSIEEERGGQPGAAETRCESGRLPMPPGNGSNQALSPRASAALAHHLGVGAGFVDEYQFVGIETGLIGLPVFPSLSDVGSVLFARVQAFF